MARRTKRNYFWVSRIKRLSHAYQRVTGASHDMEKFRAYLPSASDRAHQNPHQKSESPDGEGSTLYITCDHLNLL